MSISDGDPGYSEPPSSARPRGGLRVFQFTLSGMFAVVTAMSLVLAIYFGVGRLLGMSTIEILSEGFGRFLFTLPIFLVWIVGLTIAIGRRKQDRLRYTLAAIAFGILATTTIIVQVVFMVLVHSVNSGNNMLAGKLDWFFTGVSIFSVAVNTICEILILIALFLRRPAEKPQPDRDESVQPER